MSHPVLANPWVRAVGALLAIVLVAILAYVLRPVLVPLFLAFIVAYVFDPVVDYFQVRKIPRTVTIAGLAFVAFLLFVSVPLVVVPGIVSQGASIAKTDQAAPVSHPPKTSPVTQPAEDSASTASQDKATTTPGQPAETSAEPVERAWLDGLLIQVGWLDPNEKNPNSLDIIKVKVGKYVHESGLQFLRNNAAGLASAGKSAGLSIASAFGTIGSTAFRFVMFIANFAIFALVAGYLLKDFDNIVAAGRGLIPPRYAPKTVEIMTKIDVQLKSFLRGQMTVCVCMGVLYTIGFAVSGLQMMAIVIGVFGMFASLVPYIGVMVVAVFSLIMAVVQYDGLTWHVIGVLVTIVIVQALEGNVITPLIVGEQVGLSPVWVILAIMVFGSFLGFLGLLLAVPIAAVLKVLVVEAVAAYKTSPVFEGGPSTVPEPASSADLERPPARKRRR